MFDIGWSELLLIGVVALIVIGPEDLPKLFHTLGRLTARARSMAREFSSAMEDAAKSSGLDDAAKTLKEVKGLGSKRALGLDALERATERFEKWDPLTPTRADAAQKGPTPDPAAPRPPDPAVEGNDALPPAPGVSAPLPTEATDSDSATSGRRLHAVRRSDRA
ncbi:twin-arginine translocase subunit TatB [Paracoccus kondratievae]|uniref:Sec-independent protein translocase protein TatB n=1 Tax=Paracoccus kondratievae TaxID=135740 RepID=A0AAD3NYG9_9RHOB|nr:MULTISPECIES: Sec-independent protein translocase protein TatB [Paracoccus]QFQ86850.1 twin-arginine translocase subunit TatB [Paracoccus kondratievae]GLK63558.1 Sec-independent protein translocase protein TatB [Paracoccus kondratievae]SMG30145.1 sec-independent protein translocase protein TatB [Paracoccus sp. J56]